MAEQGYMSAGDEKQERTDPKIAKQLKAQADQCVRERRDLITDWTNSINRRRGKESNVDSDQNRQRTTEDWSMTNAKIAQLFSQLPRVIVTGRGPYKLAGPVFEDRLNWRLEKASVGTTMNEIMVDTVNAAGVGIANVEYESTMEEVEIEEIIPEIGFLRRTAMKLGLEPLPTKKISRPVDRRFSVNRISADNFIWPTNFQRSNFDFAPFLGYDGEMPWVRAKAVFNLKDSEKSIVVGRDKQEQDKMVPDTEHTDRADDDEVVPFQELFYWRYLYHADEKYFSAIQRVVFVKGKDEPVINERWKGQQFDPQVPGGYIGACRFPIRVFTLHYISNEAIPPSDSAVIRPLVRGMEKTFEQIEEQREHSKPVRWINSDRIDADILAAWMAGDWQGHIPVQGDGSSVIGEVARATYPNEDFAFHRAYHDQLVRALGLGPNQMGAVATGGKSATESGIVQANFSTRVTQERALAVAFFLGIADVMAGLMCLYDDFELPAISGEQQQQLTMWDRKRISHELAFSIRGDATVIMDAEQRFNRVERFLNIAGKSGYLKNPGDLLMEMASLSQVNAEIATPEPKEEKPNLSFRFSGDDLANPLVIALMDKFGYMPTPPELEAAKTIAKANGLLGPIIKDTMVDVTPDGSGGGGEPEPPPAAPPMADDRPEWQMVDRINSRRDASQNGGV